MEDDALRTEVKGFLEKPKSLISKLKEFYEITLGAVLLSLFLYWVLSACYNSQYFILNVAFWVIVSLIIISIIVLVTSCLSKTRFWVAFGEIFEALPMIIFGISVIIGCIYFIGGIAGWLKIGWNNL